MAFTDNCDVFGSVHEDGLNLIGRHLMQQRPSLFNYGTQMFAANPGLLCRKIEAHPEVTRRGNPLITVEDPLPLLGTDGLLGVNFCFQITKLALDIHPGNIISLPGELSPPLGTQRMALHAEICGGIACPDRRIQDRYGDSFEHPPIKLPGQDEKDPTGKDETGRERGPIVAIPADKVECFCLQLFAIVHMEILRTATGEQLAIRLDDVEIVDIRPEGLENSLECYIAATLRVGILPRVRISLDTMIFEMGKFATLAVSPTPTSGAVPRNPALEEDQIKVFINVGVSP